MTSLRSLQITGIILLLAIAVIILEIKTSVVSTSSQVEKAVRSHIFRLTASTTVRELKDADLPEIHPHACIRSVKFANQMTAVICMKRLDDTVSGVIFNQGAWEIGEVNLMLNLTAYYPGGTMLDLGANLGMFSIAVAASNYKVVSVDPLPINLAYVSTSMRLSGCRKNVRLIQNTVSEGHTFLYGWMRDKDNEGALTFVTKEEAASVPAEQIVNVVHSTTFEEILETIESDTVIVKIDIEGHECKALTRYFNGDTKIKFIPYIMLEWIHISANRDNTCPELNRFIEGFLKSGYYPVDVHVGAPKLDLVNEKGWLNVLWVHKDAKIWTFQ